MRAQLKVLGGGKRAGIASVIIVIVIIAMGFLVSVPVSTAVPVQIPVPQTQTVTFTTSSTTVVPVASQGTATSTVFGISQTTVRPNQYTDTASYLTPGSDVVISYRADDVVDVYVFSSTQYSQYVSSRTVSSNIAWQSGASSGIIGFHVYSADNYYLVLHNPNPDNIGARASGTDTYPATTYTYVSQEVTYTTTGVVVTTLTAVGTNTQTCSHQFWNWLFGATRCP